MQNKNPARDSSARRRRLNLAVLVLVNLLWAAQYPAYKVASDHMSVAALNFWCFLFAIILLLPFLFAARPSGGCRATRGPQVSLSLAIRQYLLLGVAGILPASAGMAWGINRSTASNGAILSLTIPLLMTLLSVILLGEKMTRLRLAALLLAFAGTLFASKGDIRGDLFDRRMLIGNVVIVLAGLGSAFYNTYGKKLLERHTEIQVLVYGYIVALAGCAVISIVADRKPLYKVSGYPLAAWFALFVLGAFPWGAAMMLWMWVLRQLAASQVAVSIYLLSIFGVLLSALSLHERLNVGQIGGGVMVLVSTCLVSGRETRNSSA